MIVFVALLLTVLTFAYVTYPLLRQKPGIFTDSAEDEDLQELHSRRNTTYSMLKELEFDYQSGILSKEDYEELQKRYKGKAVAILRDIDGLQQAPAADDEIEKQVLALRQQKARFCPQCGTEHQEGDRFCARCGAKLTREGQQ